MDVTQILTIIPADDWLAAYWIEATGERFKLPLTCFALTRATTHAIPGESVEGMLASGEFAKDCPGFLEYTRIHDMTVIDHL